MSVYVVGASFSNPNFGGTRCSGAMKGVVPPSTSDFDDFIPRLGSCTTVMNLKFARDTKAGVLLVVRISA